MAMVRGLMRAGVVLGLVALALGFTGRWWGWGDSLAVARSWLGLAGLAWLAFCGLAGAMRWRALAVPGLAVLAVLATVAWDKWRPEPGGPAALVLYQKNMNFRMPSVAPLVEDIAAVAPDVVTLQEVDAENRAVLGAIAGALPGQHFCDWGPVGGTAVAARWAKLDGRCGPGWAAMRVDRPGGAVWLVSLHLHWPAPYGQFEHLSEILPELGRLEGPVFLGGDFNMVPWSGAMARVEAATGTRHVGRARLSLEQAGGRLLLPIDHVLAPEGWRGRSARRARFGSDHYGIVAELVAP